MFPNRVPYFAAIAWIGLLMVAILSIAFYRLPALALHPWAERLLLTDFCLTTEARYLRHFNTFEPLAPFQDLPGYYEHAPGASFILPPVPLHQRAKR
ncbi:MAG: hypothetical protein RMJ44_05955 [Cytophagales bacterium]|nr:hypothetical protein [Bernardetiaceae bacterium]MDW8210612.1 hypothetical protein [Cytophagales bacterium]